MQVPPDACRGERSGFWGRRAPIQAVSLGLIVMGWYWQSAGPAFEVCGRKGAGCHQAGLPENMCQSWTNSLRATAATPTWRLPFRAPLAQGRGAPHPQNGLGPLDEEMAEVRPRPLLPTPSLIFLSLPLWRWPGLGPM